jgi:hypothetical protein
MYDGYEKDIKQDETTTTSGGMNYKFVFNDNSTVTMYCEYNTSKSGYIIKAIAN